MRFLRHTSSAALFAAALLAALSASAGGGAGTELLRFKPRLGDATNYQTAVDMTMSIARPGLKQPLVIQGKFEATSEHKVSKAGADGGGEIVETTLSQQSLVNGRQTVAEKPLAVTTTYDARGRVLSVKGVPVRNPLAQMIAGDVGSGNNGIGLFLPAQEVKPGDNWTAPARISGLGASGIAQCSFLKVENVGGYRTARIHSHLKLPITLMLDASQNPTQDPRKAIIAAAGTMTTDTYTSFAISEGKTIRSTGQTVYSLNVRPAGIKPPPAKHASGKTRKAPAKPVIADMSITAKMTIAVNMVQK